MSSSTNSAGKVDVIDAAKTDCQVQPANGATIVFGHKRILAA